MKRLPLAAAALLGAACAPATAGSGDDPGLRGPAVEVVVVPVDQTPREALLGGDVAVVTYVDIPQVPLGCDLVARLLVESTNLPRVRTAVADRAGALGATLMVVADRSELRTETSTSRAGVGLPIISNRHVLDAYDCR
jgi:hypothetical protein